MGTKHHPTPEERDERVSVPLDPETAIEAFLATGPHPQDKDEPAEDVGGGIASRRARPGQ